jgi:hypothetical protein
MKIKRQGKCCGRGWYGDMALHWLKEDLNFNILLRQQREPYILTLNAASSCGLKA